MVMGLSFQVVKVSEEDEKRGISIVYVPYLLSGTIHSNSRAIHTPRRDPF